MGTKSPKIPESTPKQVSSEKIRLSSFGLLLRRSKSTELKGKKGGGELQRKELAKRLENEPTTTTAVAQAIITPSTKPPSLPKLYNTNNNNNDGGGGPSSLFEIQNLSVPRDYHHHHYHHHHSVMPNSNSNNNPNNNSSNIYPQRTLSNPLSTTFPIPPIPTIDPYVRAESMTHRGRYSYASSAVSSINSPRRMRRRKDPTPFNVLIIGARSSGKTSFLNFLKTSLALTGKKNPIAHDTWHQEVRSGNFVSSFIETEIDNERIGLTVWDSEGLERNVVDLQLREMTSFVESKFEETFTEETKVVRAPGARDTHIHCAFLLLDPVRLDNNLAHSSKPGFAVNGASNAKSTGTPSGPLDEDLDLQVLRALKGKTTVIPVIAKADTITTAHMKYLKKSVWETIKKANLDPLEPLGLDDEEEQSNPDRLEEEEEEEEEEEKEKEKDKDTEEEIPAATAKEPTTPVSASPQSNRSSKRISISSSLRRLKAENNSNGNLAIQQEIPLLPLSIISPDTYEPDLRGRQFPWGFADPMNEAHCDFPRLKEAVFCEWRAELREVSRELWYEGWRTTRLNGVGGRALRR